MVGQKTHDQQLRIIQGRENTKNAGADFDAEADLRMSAEERAARQKGRDLDLERAASTIGTDEADDRNIPRGTNQASGHHKNRVDDD